MKRVLCTFLSVLLLLSIAAYAFAAESNSSETVIPLEDGGRLVITVVQYSSRAANTVSGYKQIRYEDATGNLCWQAVLSGAYTYNGTSSYCTASEVTVTIYDTAYYTVSKAASRNLNTATASVTMGRTMLGVTVAQNTYHISCDKDGKLS